jgi:hypothetical protein
METKSPIPRHYRGILTPEQLASDLGGEVVILDLKSSQYYGLEGVGARIWDLIAAGSTVGEIEEQLLLEFDVDRERCADDLDGLLRGLVDRGLIELTDAPAD